MKGIKLLCLALGLAAFSACDVGEVGDEDGNGSGNGNGMGGGQTFTSMISPLVTGCVGCHGGGTAPNLTSFSALEAKYKMKPGASNVLATKEDHQSITYLTTEQRATVAAWIDSLP
ncbi:MAG TPA: hypothetical protein PKU97_01095 [Kofleriaceae bacterium]|nr:hypothetical protein [Kofleriaceae bacterium]